MWRILSGCFMGWSLGANNSANVFGTAVASGLVRYAVAIWLTAIFVVAGAVLEGAKCMGTYGALAALSADAAFLVTLATACTVTFLTHAAIPASTSQAVVGALLGWAALHGTPDFTKLYKIVTCWVLTPVGGIVGGWLLFRILQEVIEKHVPSLVARNRFYLLGVLVTGCYSAYCLGANNVANVTGVYVAAGLLDAPAAALVGGLSIALGVLTYSRKIMMAVGKGIVPLDPGSALAAVLAEALTLHVFTQIGVPVSSSQAIVGAVIGVGLVRDRKTVNARMVGRIAVGWVLTPVIAAAVLLALHLLWKGIPLWVDSMCSGSSISPTPVPYLWQ
ncbi:MAG: inorganic phosphate transporter [Desulfacinum sp.]|jgi:PiT family inorganic phosphate transporter|nr:inorganic phosphate transporter [Desulfacinum sp.]